MSGNMLGHINGRQGGTPKFGPQFHGVDNFLIVPRNHVVTVSEPWDKFDNVPLVSGSKGGQGGDNGPSP